MSTRDRRETDARPQIHEDAPGAPVPSALSPPATVLTRPGLSEVADQVGQRITDLAVRWFEPVARAAIFVIYFWFGFLKLIGVSPATPLAAALTSHTIGMQYFNMSFKALAIYECGLGIIFLIPALTWISAALLMIHMGIVTSPLIIVANVAWIHPLVPTLEGQYIIKDLAIIALAVGIVAYRRSAAAGWETKVRSLSGVPPRGSD
jgi:uncharacterized membrane protein YkgB